VSAKPVYCGKTIAVKIATILNLKASCFGFEHIAAAQACSGNLILSTLCQTTTASIVATTTTATALSLYLPENCLLESVAFVYI